MGLVGLCLALANTGCSALASGQHDQVVHFLVGPSASGSFAAWSEVTLQTDISSVGTTTLWGASIGLKPPSTLPDLTFLSTLQGAADNGTSRTTVATIASFPRGETSVPMYIEYLGDLHPLFKDNHTIRLDWTGTTNPAFTQWPAGGIWMEGTVTINVN